MDPRSLRKSNFDLIDLSHKLDSNLSIYPGDPVLTCRPFASIEKDGYSVHSVSLGSHTGTHIDAPSHFVANGKTIDQLSLSSLVGPALVVNLTHKAANQRITWDDLSPYSEKMGQVNILLLWTGWSNYWGSPQYFEYPYLDRHAAEEILLRGISVVGVDTLSPDPIDGPDGYGVHEVILGSGGAIVENLTNLKELNEPDIMVSLVPLNFAGCDGSPIRAYGWKGSS